MTKIYYDDSKKVAIDNSLEDTSSKIDVALNYGNGIQVPYGFSRGNDISSCIEKLSKAKSTIKDGQNWLTKTNNSFQTKDVEMKNRIQKIDSFQIKKRDLIVK